MTSDLPVFLFLSYVWLQNQRAQHPQQSPILAQFTHSTFLCTRCSSLDMHGLMFERNIYWKGQPDWGVSTRNQVHHELGDSPKM